MNLKKISVEDIRAMKTRGEKIAALTAYDYRMARLLDEAGVQILLVGDTLGMVVLGYPDTTHVTMEEMEHHTRAAARAKPSALLGADLPYQSYATPEQAVANAAGWSRPGRNSSRRRAAAISSHKCEPSLRPEFRSWDT
jgi:3-methyl-2-oxobutanoate hydroxymethyltransferase